MKFISLWQPWGALWLSPAKVHETRDWSTRYRGWLGVHAAKTREGMGDDELAEIVKRHGLEPLAFGALIGLVHLDGCQQMAPDMFSQGAKPEHDEDRACGYWTPDRFAWRRGLYRRFDTPVPYRGAQGFFEVPDDLIPRAAA